MCDIPMRVVNSRYWGSNVQCIILSTHTCTPSAYTYIYMHTIHRKHALKTIIAVARERRLQHYKTSVIRVDTSMSMCLRPTPRGTPRRGHIANSYIGTWLGFRSIGAIPRYREEWDGLGTTRKVQLSECNDS